MSGTSIYAQALRSIEENKGIAVCTRLRGREGAVAAQVRRSVVPMEARIDAKGLSYASASLKEAEGELEVTIPYMPEERLILLGAGHVGRAVCALAARCGFQVTVCDDRPDCCSPALLPDAARFLCGSFEASIQALCLTPSDYVVIVTRGHAHDRECIKAILPGVWPAYVGMIGSRRRVGLLMEELSGDGYPEERLRAICSPIGLPIGALTPEEIAVSILAEVISYRRLPELARGRVMNRSDSEADMLRYLAASDGPMAVATLIEASGSTPRKAGACMAVRPDGSITGTIGGGSAEARAIRKALDLIGSGRYTVLEEDLAAGPEDIEGMVCGGRMRILIEDWL